MQQVNGTGVPLDRAVMRMILLFLVIRVVISSCRHIDFLSVRTTFYDDFAIHLNNYVCVLLSHLISLIWLTGCSDLLLLRSRLSVEL